MSSSESDESLSISDYLISSPEPPSPTSSSPSISSETTESLISGDDPEQTMEDSSPNNEKMDYEQTQSGQASPPPSMPLVGVNPEQTMKDIFPNYEKMEYEQTQSGEATPPLTMSPLVGVNPEQTMEESSSQGEKMDCEQTQSGEATTPQSMALVIWRGPEVTSHQATEIVTIEDDSEDDEATPSPRPLEVVRRQTVQDGLETILKEIVAKKVKFLLEVSHRNQRMMKDEEESKRMMSQQVENDGSGSNMKVAAEQVDEQNTPAPDIDHESGGMKEAANEVDEQTQALDAAYESDGRPNKAAQRVDEQKIQSPNAGHESGGKPNKATDEVDAQRIQTPEAGNKSGGRPNKAASRKRSRLATKSVATISDVSFIVPADSMVLDEIVNQFVPKDADLTEAIAQRTRRLTFSDRLSGWTMETRERLNAPCQQLDKYFTHVESKIVARSVPEVVRFLLYEVSPKKLREAGKRLHTEEGYIVKSRKRVLKGGTSTRQSKSPRVVSWGHSENYNNHEKEYTKLFLKVAWNNLMNTTAEVVPSFSEFKAGRKRARVTTQASSSRKKARTATQSQPHEGGSSSFIPNILPTLDAEAVEKEVTPSESELDAARKEARITTQSQPDEGVSGIPPNIDVEAVEAVKAVETANALVDLKDNGKAKRPTPWLF